MEQHSQIKGKNENEYNVPKLTLSDLYDENIVYNSRPSYALNPWLTTEEHQSNF